MLALWTPGWCFGCFVGANERFVGALERLVGANERFVGALDALLVPMDASSAAWNAWLVPMGVSSALWTRCRCRWTRQRCFGHIYEVGEHAGGVERYLVGERWANERRVR
jgi:hypothetical protein